MVNVYWVNNFSMTKLGGEEIGEYGDGYYARLFSNKYSKEELLMSIEERKTINTNIIQNLILENRNKLSISGVLDVLSFDDQIVILETDLGMLTIKGENLKINKLSIDTTEVIIEGSINLLSYSQKDIERKNESILSKIFK